MPAFVVEDGTGLANATSYISETEADDLVSPSAAWLAYTTPQKEEALIEATSYFDIRYCGQVKGTALTDTQALLFPREKVYIRNCDTEEDVVPTLLKQVIAELARVYRSRGSLFNEPVSANTPAGEIIKTVDTVGPLREEKVYRDGTGQSQLDNWVTFPKADTMISKLLLSPHLRNSTRAVR